MKLKVVWTKTYIETTEIEVESLADAYKAIKGLYPDDFRSRDCYQDVQVFEEETGPPIDITGDIQPHTPHLHA